ncbi:MAG: hypothetical protein HYX50_03340 [Chloroflexi bacterium]|nr:hypothetical protein [Chloroflexota bacterium]
MGRSRQLGMFLAIGAAVQMLIMVIGTLRRSYMVIALPVLAATAVISGLAFWVGWTMMNTEPELMELEDAPSSVTAVA